MRYNNIGYIEKLSKSYITKSKINLSIFAEVKNAAVA